MIRNGIRHFGSFPKFVTIIALLASPCASAADAERSQMGGSIQGAPLSLSGATSTVAGRGFLTTGSRDGAGRAAEFTHPRSVTTDGTSLYIADMDNHVIRRVVIATGEVSTLAGEAGSRGSADGVGTAARFDAPFGITTDGTNLYVTDRDNCTVRKVAIATRTVTTLAGSPGSCGSADGKGAAVRFHYPDGITTDGRSLYVADTFNQTVRRIAIATGVVTTVAGKPGWRQSADGKGTAARFHWPYGVATDGKCLYVADGGNNTVRKIAIATGAVTTIAGKAGAEGFADGKGAAARFRSPTGITTDGTNLYVTDWGNATIRKIAIATGVVTTVAGKARAPGFADGKGAVARFRCPSGVTTDGANLYVADTMNNTIRKID